jgi:hypothetical protein
MDAKAVAKRTEILDRAIQVLDNPIARTNREKWEAEEKWEKLKRTPEGPSWKRKIQVADGVLTILEDLREDLKTERRGYLESIENVDKAYR